MWVFVNPEKSSTVDFWHCYLHLSIKYWWFVKLENVELLWTRGSRALIDGCAWAALAKSSVPHMTNTWLIISARNSFDFAQHWMNIYMSAQSPFQMSPPSLPGCLNPASLQAFKTRRRSMVFALIFLSTTSGFDTLEHWQLLLWSFLAHFLLFCHLGLPHWVFHGIKLLNTPVIAPGA